MNDEQMQREKENLSLPPEIDGWPGERYGVSLRPQNMYSRVFVKTQVGNHQMRRYSRGAKPALNTSRLSRANFRMACVFCNVYYKTSIFTLAPDLAFDDTTHIH